MQCRQPQAARPVVCSGEGRAGQGGRASGEAEAAWMSQQCREGVSKEQEMEQDCSQSRKRELVGCGVRLPALMGQPPSHG